MNRGRMWHRFGADTTGQSLIEVAVTLPFLLLVVVGIVDIGRIYATRVGVENAAREGAIGLARDQRADFDAACATVRNELGAGAGTCTAAPIVVVCSRGGATCTSTAAIDVLMSGSGTGGAQVSVTVTEDVTLLSFYLVGRAFSLNPVQISSTATFPEMAQ